MARILLIAGCQTEAEVGVRLWCQPAGEMSFEDVTVAAVCLVEVAAIAEVLGKAMA